MKNFKIVLFIAAFFATNIGNIAYSQAQLSCSTLRTGSDIPSNGNMECKITPTSLIFKIYELSLCTDPATPSNQAPGATNNPCTKLHDNVNGEDIDLSAGGASISLGSDVSLAEGIYTHALLKMDVDILMTTKFQFAASRTADNGTSGAFCFSNGSDISSRPAVGSGLSHISCGSAFPSNVTASRDSINLLGTERIGFQMNQEIAISTTLGGVTSVTDLYILDSDGTQSSGDVTYTPALDAVLTGSDRKFIIASQLLGPRLAPTPVVISPSTNNVELSIIVTDSSAIGFDASNGNLIDNGFNGLIMQISSN
tara:strand:+ start:31 stop:963 length:933 start_codon:yes stop_codon:yes gene_type:complete